MIARIVSRWSFRLGIVGLLPLVAVSTGAAQARPFSFGLAPVTWGTTHALIYTDLGYGRAMFSALGPERLEHRLGTQVVLGSRLVLMAQASIAPSTGVTSHAAAEADLMVSLFSPASSAILAVAVGGMRDYAGTGVAVGCLVAGIRGSRSTLVGNLRLERPFAGANDSRDALDLITSLGYTRRMGSSFRIGIEAIGEDLEGLVEADEAEGGAKVMAGPTIGLAPTAHWELIVSGGPVLWLTRSAAAGSQATRDLVSDRGYVVRTGIAYRW